MNTNILILPLFLSILFAQISYAQKTFSIDPEREIIVHFHDDVVIHKHEAASGTPADYNISSGVLRRSLDSAKVEFIGKLIPNFKEENRFVRTRQGKEVVLSDWSNTMILRIPAGGSRDNLVEKLEELPGVAYAEKNGLSENHALKGFTHYHNDETPKEPFPLMVTPFTPNDPDFDKQWGLKNTGSALQGGGTPDADIDADEAWDITTGSSTVKVGVIGRGIDRTHEDLSGKITGDDSGSGSGHETAIAGIIAAKGNNSKGIAGVAYDVHLVDAFNGGSIAGIAAAITGASDDGAQIMNYSYGLSNGHSNTIRRTIRDVYLLNRVFITSMGNDNSSDKEYPAAYKDGVVSVGATTNNDARASYSNKGNWIDVVAPGGLGDPGSGGTIFTTIYNGSNINSGGYGDVYEKDFFFFPVIGTSFAAPHVAGIAALLKSENPNLYNDDIEHLIELSAEDKFTSGFDDLFGHGRVNAHEALKLLQSPYTLTHSSTTGGTFHSASSDFPMRTYDVNGLFDNIEYSVIRNEIRTTINFSYTENPEVWCRGVESIGWTKEENHGGAKRNFGQGFCEVVPGTVTNTSAILRTYIYSVWSFNILGQPGDFIGTFPVEESNVVFAYTVHGIPGEVPFVVKIFGETLFGAGNPGQWSATASGGTPPYSYTWYRSLSSSSGPWTQVETGDEYNQIVNDEMWLRVIAADDTCNPFCETTEDIHHVQVQGCSTPPCPDPEANPVTAGPVEPDIPETFILQQNFPNPFNPTTSISYGLPEAAQVSITVYDITGRQVAVLANGSQSAGRHTVSFRAENLSSGMYIARIEAVGNSGQLFTRNIKMQLIK